MSLLIEAAKKSYFSKQDTNRLGWLPDHKVNIAEDAWSLDTWWETTLKYRKYGKEAHFAKCCMKNEKLYEQYKDRKKNPSLFERVKLNPSSKSAVKATLIHI